MEDGSGDTGRKSADITSRGVILATTCTRTKLSTWIEQVDVVAADILLGKVDNGHRERLFTVVISGMLRDITNELSDLFSVSCVLGMAVGSGP